MEEMKNNLTYFVQALSSALAALPLEELKKLEDERYTLEIRIVRKKEVIDKKLLGSVEEYYKVYTELQTLTSREEGHQFLTAKFATRAMLEGFARYLDMPISKQDKLESLRDKIVEATIGAVLRSRAIQGNHSS